MNRVTIVNLAGRAWHVEEAGVQLLEDWLGDARTRLAADPDRDELVADFERAIADRFGHLASGDRDVVTSTHVADVLAALGTVEPAGDAPHTEPESAAQSAPTSGDDDTNWRDRRLYRLTGDEEMVAGVCAGLAAYFRIDVTVVRVIVVLLTIVTSGGLIIAYIALALIVPEAKTPEQRAEALGSGGTAQEMLARARAGASPALASLGSLISKSVVVVAMVLRWTLLITVWALLAAWAVAIGWLFIDPSPLQELFDPGTSTWMIGLWLTCIAWIPTALALGLERAFAEALRRDGEPRASRPTRIALSTVWGVSFIAAIIGTLAIPASHSRELSALADGHGTITFDGREYCIDDDEIEDGRCVD